MAEAGVPVAAPAVRGAGGHRAGQDAPATAGAGEVKSAPRSGSHGAGRRVPVTGRRGLSERSRYRARAGSAGDGRRGRKSKAAPARGGHGARRARPRAGPSVAGRARPVPGRAGVPLAAREGGSRRPGQGDEVTSSASSPGFPPWRAGPVSGRGGATRRLPQVAEERTRPLPLTVSPPPGKVIPEEKRTQHVAIHAATTDHRRKR